MHSIAQLSEAVSGLAPVAQMGFGGALLIIVVRWLTRVEAGLADVTHAMRGLSKAIWMDLAERAVPGSFIREEAKRTLQRMDDKERGEELARKRE